MPNHYEDQESIALWQRAQLDPVLRDYLFHIPNGGKRNKREAGRFKRMGTRKGVHDYHLPVARGIYHSLWIELKADVKGYYPSVSKEQLDWRKKMRDQGNAAFIVKGWERSIEIMLLYLSLNDAEWLEFPDSGKFDFI